MNRHCPICDRSLGATEAACPQCTSGSALSTIPDPMSQLDADLRGDSFQIFRPTAPTLTAMAPPRSRLPALISLTALALAVIGIVIVSVNHPSSSPPPTAVDSSSPPPAPVERLPPSSSTGAETHPTPASGAAALTLNLRSFKIRSNSTAMALLRVDIAIVSCCLADFAL